MHNLLTCTRKANATHIDRLSSSSILRIVSVHQQNKVYVSSCLMLFCRLSHLHIKGVEETYIHTLIDTTN